MAQFIVKVVVVKQIDVTKLAQYVALIVRSQVHIQPEVTVGMILDGIAHAHKLPVDLAVL